MKERIRVDPEYACVLGYAIYCYCSLEWNVVWIIERLDPGYIRKIQWKTASKFSRDLAGCIEKAVGLEEPLRARLLAFSDRFKPLTRRRDALLHANPSTAPGGEQRLQYSGETGVIDWPLDDIIAASEDFESASLEANELFYRHLSKNAGVA
jgi:hypothetical protein